MEEEIGQDITNIKSYITGISLWLDNSFVLNGELSQEIINQTQKLYPNIKFLYQDKKGKSFISYPNPTNISLEQASKIINSIF